MQKVYTKKGDTGFTHYFSGRRVSKDDIVIICNGKIDQLQSAIDSVWLLAKRKERKWLEKIQVKLWQTAAEISHCDKKCLVDPIRENDLAELEKYIDALGTPPQKFVRFRNKKSIAYNECRVRARELETCIVKLLRRGAIRSIVYTFLNRLSSLFYMLAVKKR